MLKKLFMLSILLVLAMGLAIPAGPVQAGGANHIYFTAVSYSGCASGEYTDFCYGGDPQVMPNGEVKIFNLEDTIIFTATDDRWTTKCLFSADPFTLGKPNAWPLKGSFVCYPKDPKYAGGYWAGNVFQVVQNSKVLGLWTAKGYGTFDGLLASAYNNMSNNFQNRPPGITDAGVITELPGYQR
jgi:hypothetical protein